MMSTRSLVTSFLLDFQRVPSMLSTAYPASFLVVVLSITLFYFFISHTELRKGRDLHGTSIFTAWSFITKQYDFFQENFKRSDGRPFKFRFLQHRVTAITGQEARRKFLTEPTFNISEGQKIFSGAIHIDAVNMEAETAIISHFSKRLLLLIRRERIAEAIPTLLNDLYKRMSEWGDTGKINPFDEMFSLIFQMTIRMASCSELSEDRKTVEALQKHHLCLETNTTPFSIIFPWFPWPSKLLKLWSLIVLHKKFCSTVQQRRNASTPTADAIDLLITQGDSNKEIAGVIQGFLFAGTSNAAINLAWTVVHLGWYPKSKQQALNEYTALLQNHSTAHPSEPLHKRLAAIPLKAWEDELPLVDGIIRDTVRLMLCGPLMRRNMIHDVMIDGVEIKRGEFVTYQTTEIHLNPEIYPDPIKFDPERYLPGRQEDKREAFSHLGWGGGRHPCLGMKFAVLELKLVLALMLLGFEWQLVDSAGQYPNALPRRDINKNQTIRPLGDVCFVKFNRTTV